MKTLLLVTASLSTLAGGAHGAAQPPADPGRDLALAFGLPRIAALGATASRAMVVEAVYGATALSGGAHVGRVVNTGTVTIGPLGSRYTPEPTDKLVVETAGQTHEFVVEHARGNMQAPDASTWLASPHELRYRHEWKGQAGATFDVRFDGRGFEATVKGWQVQNGARFRLDLKATGQTVRNSGYHGQDIETRSRLRGTIRGEGLEIEVDEQHSSTLASATSIRLLPSQRGSASRLHATLNNVLRRGQTIYRFQDVLVQTDQKTKGNRTQAGVTMVRGAVLRDGAPFGRCALAGGKAVLHTEGGAVALDLPATK